MPPKIILDPSIVDKETITFGDCTHPAGHCYGSDGGSGIPEQLKVPVGRGGAKEVYELSTDKISILSKMLYNKCQFCGKYDPESATPILNEKTQDI